MKSIIKLFLFFFITLLLVNSFVTFSSAAVLGSNDADCIPDEGECGSCNLHDVRDRIYFGKYTTGSNPGDATDISFYMGGVSNGKYKAAIYDNDLNIVTNGITEERSIENTSGWFKFDFNNQPILKANHTYYLAAWCNNTDNPAYIYSCNSGGNGVWSNVSTYSAGDYVGFPATIYKESSETATWRLLIYANYTIFTLDPPTNIQTTLWANKHLNITWTNNDSADTTLLLRKRGGFPTDHEDSGATTLQNNSNEYYNDTNIEYDYWYSLFSYNSTYNTWSSAANIVWGGIVINCYNESDATENLTFDVYITNIDGTDTYVDTDCDNPHVIDLANTPTGDKTIIQIKATGYNTRYYYKDLEIPGGYLLNTYLLHNTLSNLYYVRVIDKNDLSIEDARIQFRRYINSTVGFDNVSVLYTDAYGQCDIYLEPDVVYKVNLAKDGYQTKTDDYIPDALYYGIYYPKTFLLLFSLAEPDSITFADIIDFSATINSDGNITVQYHDQNSHTTNTEINIFEYYNGTMTFNNTNSRTGESSFSWTTTGYDTTKTHAIQLYLNHSEIGFHIVWIYTMPIDTQVEESTYEEYFSDVFGDFDLGWVKLFFIFVPCIFFLVVFGAAHAGLGVMVSGLYLGFSTYFLDVSSDVSYTTIAALLVLVGIIVIIVKRGVRVI